MVQSVSVPGKPALNKLVVARFGPAVGGGIAILGFLLTVLGFFLPWLKFNGDGSKMTLNGFELLTKTGPFDLSEVGDTAHAQEMIAMLVRGSSFNALLCDMPFFLCGGLIIALILVGVVLAKKFPPPLMLYGSIVLVVMGLFSCCPGVLFFIDMQKEMWDSFPIQLGYYLAVFGISAILMGGLVGIITILIGGGFPKRDRA